MKLLKIHLRYYPPGIVLEYTQKGETKNKEIDLLELDANCDTKELANELLAKEKLLTEDVKEDLEQVLETLKKRIEHEGPSGKRFYIYKTLLTHCLPVTNVAFDKSGKRCLTGSYDRTCKVWDVEQGQELKTLSGHQNVVYTVAFNFPLCNRVITSSFDKSAKIWDPESGECLATLWGHTGEVVTAQFNVKCDYAATGSMDNTAKLYDVNTESGCGSGTSRVCFSPAGGSLLTASADRSARIWNTTTGNCIQVLSGHGGEIFSCAYSYAGDAIITASKDNTCRIWR
ncbi:dynein assembly factor with WDR repeat domains 1 [Hyposmocoma kahamanoa]|uniref:dynein assembly factor with WDR repeat domains 1 n=1 Tax=Hyposmocoma kahamanoa TaxID=1477025 RepID=UPI000E6D9E36|nr:dynein assembly factor with WDR repeat domains 1 [Hyposmocoma kahamanoa]